MTDDLRILGIPFKDGYYWYFQLGKPQPTIVLAGEYKGERAIKTAEGGVQRCWLDGEFFVGPIGPPYATPASLANPTDAAYKAAYENMRHTDGRMGVDGSRLSVDPDRVIE